MWVLQFRKRFFNSSDLPVFNSAVFHPNHLQFEDSLRKLNLC